MVNKHIKAHSISLTIREMYTKTMMKYHYLFIIVAKIKYSSNRKC